MKHLLVIQLLSFLVINVAMAELRTMDFSANDSLLSQVNPSFEQSGDLATALKGNSSFAELKDEYKKGEVPTESDLVGWYSGRCYWDNNRSAYNYLLVTYYGRGFNNHDSTRKNSRVLKIRSLGHSKGAADYFDDMTGAEKKEIENYVSRSDLDARAAVIENNAYVGRFFAASERNTYQTSIRRVGDYFVMTQAIDGSSPFAFCHTVKKVK